MGCWDVEGMLDSMTAGQFARWQAFELWEIEMDQRAILQAKADASLETMKRGR